MIRPIQVFSTPCDDHPANLIKIIGSIKVVSDAIVQTFAIQ